MIRNRIAIRQIRFFSSEIVPPDTLVSDAKWPMKWHTRTEVEFRRPFSGLWLKKVVEQNITSFPSLDTDDN